MAESRLNCDKNAIVFLTKANEEDKQLTFSYDQIARIQIDKFAEKKLLRKVPSEKIEIFIKNRNTPLIFTKLKDKDFFEGYKKDLIRFSKDNKVALIDNTAQ